MAISKLGIFCIVIAIILIIVIPAVLIWYFVTHPEPYKSSQGGADGSEQKTQFMPDPTEAGITKNGITESGSKFTEDGITKQGITKAGITDSFVTRAGITESRVTESGITDSFVTRAGITESRVTESEITDSFTRAGITESRVTESGITDSFVTRAGITESRVTESGITDSFVTRAGITESRVTESGITDSFVTRAGITESRVTESEITGSFVTRAGITESRVTASGITDSFVTKDGITESGATGSEITDSFVTKSGITESGTTEPGEIEPWFNPRLPEHFIPFHYEVELRPILVPDLTGLYWFEGRSNASFTVTENTSTLLIHSTKLNFTEVKLVASKAAFTVPILRHWFYEENEYLIVETATPLEADTNYTLETVFFGELKNDMTGLYRSQYVKPSGDIKIIVASQMQTTYARKTFPCFDEPGLKATFDVSLWHGYEDLALSNMPQKEEMIQPGEWIQTKFHTTPPMSTYLLAFAICDFGSAEADTTTDPPVKTRVYARRQQISAGHGDYAISISPDILDYYTNFFGVAYPLPKADQIAVPDFDVFSAMENWGLIVYREIRLLHDEATSSVFDKQKAASVIAHELTHQWFGNIISPLWWDEIWLNEGFASYIEYLGVHRVEPTWQMHDQFVVDDFHRAMSIDGLVTSRPIVAQDVNTKEEIDALFDQISYAKGACIIRMIRAFAGDTAFRLGLKNYINENKYGSVTHQQLFKYWEQAIIETETGSIPPGGFINAMNTWVMQMGFPTVTLKRHDKDPSKMVASQERFLLDPLADQQHPKSPFGYSWVIPLWYATEGNLKRNLTWLSSGPEDKCCKVTTISVPENEFILGNYEVFGYYRVNYDEENWKRIIAKLNENFEAIETKTRGQLLDDAFNLARANRLSYDIALNLSKILLKDFNYISWKSAVDGFLYLDKMLARSNIFQHYSNFLIELVSPSFEDFGWNIMNEHLDKFQQKLILEKACSLGIKKCQKSVNRQFHKWMSSQNQPKRSEVIPNFRPVVYCQALSQGGEEEWNFVWETYIDETDSLEKSTLLDALACTKDEKIVRRLLEETKNGTNIRNQDGPTILVNLCSNDAARDTVWNFIKTEWDFVLESYGSALTSFRNIIQTCTFSFSTADELKDLKAFIADHDERLGYGWKPFEQAVEQVNANIQWRMRNEEFLDQWFQTVKFE